MRLQVRQPKSGACKPSCKELPRATWEERGWCGGNFSLATSLPATVNVTAAGGQFRKRGSRWLGNSCSGRWRTVCGWRSAFGRWSPAVLVGELTV